MSGEGRTSRSIIIQGDARQRLSLLPDQSVHMMATSSPYYGLRDYGADPQIWGGDPNCQHEWDKEPPRRQRSPDDIKSNTTIQAGRRASSPELPYTDSCSKCGAWKGELGPEPTPEMFIEHLVMIFREARRVLRDDGVIWVNMGDSYASGKGSCFNPGGNENSIQDNVKQSGGIPTMRPNKSEVGSWGMKPKDLMEIPSMLAAALRADGWYLRSRIPWIKRNALPSSVKDRPSSSIEYIFLLSKSKKYYYDYVATMQPSSESYNKDKRPRGVLRQCVNNESKYPDEGQFARKYASPLAEELESVPADVVKDGLIKVLDSNATEKSPQKQDLCGNPTLVGFNARYENPGTGLRYMRDSDFFFRTWQGLLHNEDGEPMAFVVNPKGYKGAHFACFPVGLIEPMIVAGTSEKGVCPECGAPWVRTVNKERIMRHELPEDNPNYRPGRYTVKSDGRDDYAKGGAQAFCSVETTGWLPSCSCDAGDPVPATVLDPFAGSGATGVACQLHNRNFIGIELKPEYCDLARKRLEENK